MRRKQYKCLRYQISSSKRLRQAADIWRKSWDTLLSTRAPQIANEITSQSVELVPLPSSSTMTRLHLEILVNMNAISRISLENVLTLNSIPSSTEMRVNNCSNIGNTAYTPGTLRLAFHLTTITVLERAETHHEEQNGIRQGMRWSLLGTHLRHDTD